MNTCPKCHAELSLISYAEKEVLQCSTCRGFWFRDNLFREIKQIGFAGLCADTPAAASAPPPAAASLACPDCTDALIAYKYAYSSDIQLHRCLKCKGIWADYEALIEIEALLVNYQESLEEAKAKALPLLLEVKQQTEAKEKAQAEERKRRRKGFFKNWFRKKQPGRPTLDQVIEDLPTNENQ